MSDNGWTKGPWAVSKNSSGRRVTNTVGIVICNAVLRNTGRADRGVNYGSKEHKEAERNAHLIAAAPDLAEAARFALEITQDVFDGKVDPVLALDAICDLSLIHI